jgi:hypothetical protein
MRNWKAHTIEDSLRIYVARAYVYYLDFRANQAISAEITLAEALISS